MDAPPYLTGIIARNEAWLDAHSDGIRPTRWRTEAQRERRAASKRRTRQRKATPRYRPRPSASAILIVNCRICNRLFIAHGRRLMATTCGDDDCRTRREAERKARNLAKATHRAHMRRTVTTDLGLTREQEAEMRRKTRKCVLCGIWMTSKPRLPNSKELDHILPVNQGGTHTHGNVRIICRHCNVTRPKDGSDWTGMLTLWAQAPDLQIAPSRKPKRPVPALRQCKCGTQFAAPGSQFMCANCISAVGRRAAELHASGDVTWDQVAAEVGYQSGWGAAYAAKRTGYTPVSKPKMVKPKNPPLQPCACGSPRQPHAPMCLTCWTGRAWRAVALYETGMTLRQVGDQLGCNKDTVVGLMQRVVIVHRRYGATRIELERMTA